MFKVKFKGLLLNTYARTIEIINKNPSVNEFTTKGPLALYDVAFTSSYLWTLYLAPL